jgi:hypothetical protein
VRMTEPRHRISLSRGWRQVETPGPTSEEPAVGKTVCWSRSFQASEGLLQATGVRLQFAPCHECSASLVSCEINGHALALREANTDYDWDITQRLQRNNRLKVSIGLTPLETNDSPPPSEHPFPFEPWLVIIES